MTEGASASFPMEKKSNLATGAFVDTRGASLGACRQWDFERAQGACDRDIFSVLLIQRVHLTALFLFVLAGNNQGAILTAGGGPARVEVAPADLPVGTSLQAPPPE